MDPAVQELHKAHREGLEKYVYFLLAAAGTAIAFAITQTQTATLSPTKIPLGAAMAFWALSFYCGCRQLLETSGILYQNYQFLRMRGDVNFPGDPNFFEELQADLEKQADKSGTWGKWQFRLLIAGAVLYIGWHIMEMYLRA
jgi:hypothetical protein